MLRISFKRAHCVERLCVGQSVSKDDDMRYRDPGTGAQWWAQAGRPQHTPHTSLMIMDRSQFIKLSTHLHKKTSHTENMK